MKKAIIILATLLSACSGGSLLATSTPEPTPTDVPCSEQSADFITAIDSIMERWNDTNELASGTARIALSAPVGDLQEVRREVTALVVPPCSESIKESLSVYMDTQIDAYLAFMADSEGDEVEQGILLATMHELVFTDIYSTFKDGNPISGRVAYFVDGNRTWLDVTLNGEVISDAETPWFEFETVEPNETLTLSGQTRSNSSGAVYCLIFSAGELIASDTQSGFAANASCTGVAK